MASTKVKKLNIKRDKDYIYFVDSDGDVSKSKRRVKNSTQKVKKVGITKKKGFLYFLDKDGDISMSKMARK